MKFDKCRFKVLKGSGRYGILNATELKKIAKDNKVKGYTKLKKQELIDLLLEKKIIKREDVTKKQKTEEEKKQIREKKSEEKRKNINYLRSVDAKKKLTTTFSPDKIDERKIKLKKYPIQQLRSHFKGVGNSYDLKNRLIEKIAFTASDQDIKDLGEPEAAVRNYIQLAVPKAKPFNEERQADFIDEENKNKNYNIIKGGTNDNVIILKNHQVKFLIHFYFSGLQSALLFHGTGTGKTLTACAASYMYLKLKPNNNVIYICPPSLIGNFIKSMHAYGLEIQDNRYMFLSYDKALRYSKNLTNDKIAFLAKSIIIIDEVHYIRTEIIEKETTNEKGDRLMEIEQNKKGHAILTMLSKCDKSILMTATPFINKLYDIENIMAGLGQRQPMREKTFYEITTNSSSIIDYFKYRISHFEIPVPKNENDLQFPKRIQSYVALRLDEKNAKLYNSLIQTTGVSDDQFEGLDVLLKNRYRDISSQEQKRKAAFYNAARTLSVSIGDLKMKHLINRITNPLTTGKYIIYSIFTGLSVSKSKKKIDNMEGGNNDVENIAMSKKGIEYIIENLRKIQNIQIFKITGTENLQQRERSKEGYNKDIINNGTINPKENGLKVLIISDAGTEGIDTKNTEGLFIMEPLWNEARTDQAIARAIRFKSHQALNNNLRMVYVYRYVVTSKDQEDELIKKINDAKIDEVLQSYNEFKEMKKRLYELSGSGKYGSGSLKAMHEGVKRFKLEAQLKAQKERQQAEIIKELKDDLQKMKLEYQKTKNLELKNDIIDLEERLKTFVPVDIDMNVYRSLSPKDRAAYLKSVGVATRYEASQFQNQLSNLTGALPGPELSIVLLSIAKQATIYKFIETLDNDVKTVEDTTSKIIDDYYDELKDKIDNIKNKLTKYNKKRSKKEDNEKYKDKIDKYSDILNRYQTNEKFPPVGEKYIKKIRNETFNISELFKEGNTLSKILTKEAEDIKQKRENWGTVSKQQYFTPESVLNMIVDNKGRGYLTDIINKSNNKKLKSLISLNVEEIKKQNTNDVVFLEPTAGSGNIVKHIMLNNIYGSIIKSFYAVEYDKDYRDLLKEKANKLGNNILNVAEHGNFLSYVPSIEFDIIVMNPPFNIRPRFMSDLKGTPIYNNSVYDLDFVKRAYYFLKPDGVLVALVYGGHVSDYVLVDKKYGNGKETNEKFKKLEEFKKSDEEREAKRQENIKKYIENLKKEKDKELENIKIDNNVLERYKKTVDNLKAQNKTDDEIKNILKETIYNKKLKNLPEDLKQEVYIDKRSKYRIYLEWLKSKNAIVSIENIKGWDGNPEGFSDTTTKKSGKISAINIGFVRIIRTKEMYDIEKKNNEDENTINPYLNIKYENDAKDLAEGKIPSNQLKEYADSFNEEQKQDNIINVQPPKFEHRRRW